MKDERVNVEELKRAMADYPTFRQLGYDCGSGPPPNRRVAR